VEGRSERFVLFLCGKGGTMNTSRKAPPRFALGQVVATPGALAALSQANQTPLAFLQRHQAGDWGEVSPTDKQENDFSVEQGFRILSAYPLNTGVKLWLLTEADRSYTTLLLPHEY
jgi:hypothetical protein